MDITSWIIGIGVLIAIFVVWYFLAKLMVILIRVIIGGVIGLLIGLAINYVWTTMIWTGSPAWISSVIKFGFMAWGIAGGYIWGKDKYKEEFEDDLSSPLESNSESIPESPSPTLLPIEPVSQDEEKPVSESVSLSYDITPSYTFVFETAKGMDTFVKSMKTRRTEYFVDRVYCLGGVEYDIEGCEAGSETWVMPPQVNNMLVVRRALDIIRPSLVIHQDITNQCADIEEPDHDDLGCEIRWVCNNCKKHYPKLYYQRLEAARS